MSIKINKTLILNEIQKHYNFKKKNEFAIFLGIAPTTLSSWEARNTFDYELLYEKCVGIDANWLFTGKGAMFNTSEEDIGTKSIPLMPIKENNEMENNIIKLSNRLVLSFDFEMNREDLLLSGVDVRGDLDALVALRRGYFVEVGVLPKDGQIISFDWKRLIENKTLLNAIEWADDKGCFIFRYGCLYYREELTELFGTLVWEK